MISGTPPQTGIRTATQPIDVLVVDDNAPTGALLVDVLDFAGYTASAARDGAAALAIAERQQPRLILLDLCMPVMSGWQFVSHYRAVAAPHAEIVLLSAHRDVVEATEKLGVYGFVRKPFDVDQLLAVVQRAIGPATATRALRRAVAGASVSSSPVLAST